MRRPRRVKAEDGKHRTWLLRRVVREPFRDGACRPSYTCSDGERRPDCAGSRPARRYPCCRGQDAGRGPARDRAAAQGVYARPSLPYRRPRHATGTRIYRDTYKDFTAESIILAGEFGTRELLGLASEPASEPELESTVRAWLERLAASWPTALPKADSQRKSVVEHLVRAVSEGRVMSGSLG